MTLDKGKLNHIYTIHRINNDGEIRKRLLDMGFTVGTKVQIIKVAPLQDPIEVSLRGYNISIRREDCKQIIVS